MYRFYTIELIQFKTATDLKTSSGIGISLIYFCKSIRNVYFIKLSGSWNRKIKTILK